MSTLSRGLRQYKILLPVRAHLQVEFIQHQIRGISLCLRPEDLQPGQLFQNYNQTRLLSWNTLSFPPSPPSNIQPEEPDASHAAFLEEAGEEYGYHMPIKSLPEPPSSEAQSQSHLTLESVSAELQVLLRLLSRQELSTALAIKEEYDRLGVHLDKQNIFADYALAELEVRDSTEMSDLSTRTRRFLAWWSLVPLSSCQTKVMQVSSKLMEDFKFEIPLLMGFCRLCSEAHDLLLFRSAVLNSRMLPHIIRFGEVKATTALLIKLKSELGRMGAGEEIKTELRNLFAKIHFLSGRKELSELLRNRQSLNSSTASTSTNTFELPTQTEKLRSSTSLALELRAIRYCLLTGTHPKKFSMFISRFIQAYESLGRRSRAIHYLRKRFLIDAPIALRASWVAGEQHFLATRDKPLAGLRIFFQYCTSDPILEAECKRVLKAHRNIGKFKRSQIDWKSASTSKTIDVKWKSWPSSTSVHLAWKFILKLSKTSELERLYRAALSQAHASFSDSLQIPEVLQKAVHNTPEANTDNKTQEPLTLAVDYSQTSTSVFQIPAVPYNARLYFHRSLFHHFTVALATRVSPSLGLQVIADMEKMGLSPALDTWIACAGALARSGDVKGAINALKHIESGVGTKNSEKAESIPDNEALDSPSPTDNTTTFDMVKKGAKHQKTLQKAYNSVLRGFVEVGLFAQSRELGHRMLDLNLMNDGTKSILRRMVKLEANWDSMLGSPGTHVKSKYRYMDVSGHRLKADRDRASWVHRHA